MMTKNELIEFQEKNLDRVNYWLQFAEAKNAALIAFTVAILAVVYQTPIISDTVLCIIITISHVAVLIITIIATMPRNNEYIHNKIDVYRETDNLIYWKDISKYAIDDYIEILNGYLNFDENLSDLDKKQIYIYSEEIIINSRIARKKYELFSLALKISILGNVLIPLSLLIIA